MVTELKEYFSDYYNCSDLIVCVLVSICQYYYWATGKIVNGYFFPEDDSYFEVFLLPTILALHLNLILQHMIAFEIIRRYVVMIIKTFEQTLPFYVVLFLFIASYFIFLLFTQDDGYLPVFKVAYTLTLGELNFEDLNMTNFVIFIAYTLLITLMLMNLVIAILSDAYELVTSETKYYDGKAKMRRSLMYERLRKFIMKPFTGEKKQTYHYLFVSMPLGYEDDANNEDEGMIGKILHATRSDFKEVSKNAEANQLKVD